MSHWNTVTAFKTNGVNSIPGIAWSTSTYQCGLWTFKPKGRHYPVPMIRPTSTASVGRLVDMMLWHFFIPTWVPSLPSHFLMSSFHCTVRVCPVDWTFGLGQEIQIVKPTSVDDKFGLGILGLSCVCDMQMWDFASWSQILNSWWLVTINTIYLLVLILENPLWSSYWKR